MVSRTTDPAGVAGTVRHLPQTSGISLGVTPDAHYRINELTLSPGESVLFHTDGVIEARNEDNELFGNDRLVYSIKNTEGPPWGEALLDLLQRWRGKAPASDDVTLLEIWREPING